MEDLIESDKKIEQRCKNIEFLSSCLSLTKRRIHQMINDDPEFKDFYNLQEEDVKRFIQLYVAKIKYKKQDPDLEELKKQRLEIQVKKDNINLLKIQNELVSAEEQLTALQAIQVVFLNLLDKAKKATHNYEHVIDEGRSKIGGMVQDQIIKLQKKRNCTEFI